MCAAANSKFHMSEHLLANGQNVCNSKLSKPLFVGQNIYYLVG